ncbi:MAG: hypothetical protein HGA36_03650 [Candidatus Moranbacteria bacterium]|nr:hypothetical protein [Candidatus Moranbacteria bacterium]
MNDSEAKETIRLLVNEYGAKEDLATFFCGIVETIATKKDGEFEFSFVENEKKIRFNHFYFFNNGLTAIEKGKRWDKRIEQIKKALQDIERIFCLGMDYVFFDKIINFAKLNGLLPVHFGIEYDATLGMRIKIYLGINEKMIDLRGFCKTLNVSFKLIMLATKNLPLDTIAFDFSPGKLPTLKLYPIISKHKGLLLRIGANGNIESAKIWQRFPVGIKVGKYAESEFLIAPSFLHENMMLNKFKFSYICLEKGKKSLYWR